jgi:predicted transcriptional regulator
MNTMNRSTKSTKLKRSAAELQKLIDDIVREKIDIPDNSVIVDSDVLLQLVTRKRLELLYFIDKHNPKSLQELADLTGRKKQAINRDLRILEQRELLTLEKKGRTKTPKVARKYLLVGITDVCSMQDFDKSSVQNA